MQPIYQTPENALAAEYQSGIEGVEFKSHPDHIHIVLKLNDGSTSRIVDTVYPLDKFKLLVTQFLCYYREGGTDISSQVTQVPLESSWLYTPPGHIEEPGNKLFLYRRLMYDFVDESNLFQITYTPPSYTEKNIKMVRQAFKKQSPKEWLSRYVAFGKGHEIAVNNFSDPPTKEEVLVYARLRASDCQKMPFCIPLLKLTVEMLGGPILPYQQEWHHACPIWSMCKSGVGCAHDLTMIGAELGEKFESLDKLSEDCKARIQRFKNYEYTDEVAALEKQVTEWDD